MAPPTKGIKAPLPASSYGLVGKNVFIGGGTAGIGEAIAISFAKRGANIYIGGRNAAAAEKILAEAKTVARAAFPDAQPSYGFYPFDASSITDTKRLANELVTLFSTPEQGGLHFLILAQGGIASITAEQRVVTKEGHEWWLAVQDFSRFILVSKLAPILNATDNGGVIFDVLSAGMWNEFDENNLELEGRSIHFHSIASRDGPVHEVFTLEFNERYPRVKYNHAYPGVVKTGIGNGTSFLTRLLRTIAGFFISVSAADYGENVLHNATLWDRYENATNDADVKELLSKRSWRPGAIPVPIKEYPKKPEVRKKVIAFMEAATGVEAGSA